MSIRKFRFTDIIAGWIPVPFAYFYITIPNETNDDSNQK